MATTEQTKAALENVTKAQEAATSEETTAHMSEQTRTALAQQQGAAVARRKRTAGGILKTRAELYEIAKQRDLPGRTWLCSVSVMNAAYPSQLAACMSGMSAARTFPARHDGRDSAADGRHRPG